MKIGIVSPYDMSRPGGVQEVIANLSEQFSGSGHFVTIIAPRPPRNPSWSHEGIITIGRSRLLHKPLKTSAELSWAAKNEIDEVLQEGRFDILNVHEPWVPFLPRQFIRQSQLPLVATFHATLPGGLISASTQLLVRPYARKLWPKLKSLIAVSPVVAEQLAKFTSSEVRVIPNGIDPEPFRAKMIAQHPLCRPDRKNILYLGRLEERKGVGSLISACSGAIAMGKLPLRLIIAGDGPLKNELSELAGHIGVDKIHFLGRVSDKEKISLLRSCDLFCSPALYGESFGIVLLEAMAAGVPIVAGNNPGYRAVLKGSPEPCLVDPKDVAGFADRLIAVLQDEKLRDRIVAWQDQQLPKYSYSKIANQYLKIFESIKKEEL